MIQKAVQAGAKVLFLPEAADYVASSPDKSLSLCKSVHDSVFVQGLQEEARRHKLPISVGLHEPLENSNKKMKNTLVWIDAQGKISQRYQKNHLFNMDLSSEGGPKMCERDTIEPGKEIVPPFQTDIGKIGLCMCFDLRFPEQPQSLKRQGAEIITYPSAFASHTGEMHWHALLRARAIETECYVIAAAQIGPHNESRTSYGHSMIISPMAKVLAELSDYKDMTEDWEPEVAVADIDLSKVEKMRKEIILDRRM